MHEKEKIYITRGDRKMQISHDMKLMGDLGIVKARKEGKWMQYSLDLDVMNEVYKTVGRLMIPGDYAGLLNCNCNTEKEKMNHE